MKPKLLLASIVFPLVALAQSTNSLPGASTEAPAVQLQNLIVAIIVPLVVAAIKKVLPRIPGAVLPPLAMALGALADYVGAVVGVWHGNPILGIVLGAAGVGVREAVDQLMKPNTPAPPTQ